MSCRQRSGSRARPAHSSLNSRVLPCRQLLSTGGIPDQPGGGFARYSVDDRRSVPPFEKMNCDYTPRTLGLPGSFTGDWPRRVCHGQAGMLDSRPRDMTEAARFTNRSRPFSVTKSRRSGHDEFIGNHHRLAGRHAGGRWERGSGGHSPVHHHAALHHAATLHHAA